MMMTLSWEEITHFIKVLSWPRRTVALCKERFSDIRQTEPEGSGSLSYVVLHADHHWIVHIIAEYSVYDECERS